MTSNSNDLQSQFNRIRFLPASALWVLATPSPVIGNLRTAIPNLRACLLSPSLHESSFEITNPTSVGKRALQWRCLLLMSLHSLCVGSPNTMFKSRQTLEDSQYTVSHLLLLSSAVTQSKRLMASYPTLNTATQHKRLTNRVRDKELLPSVYFFSRERKLLLEER